MGKIVGGFATSHVLFPPGGVEDKAARVLGGMMRMRAEIRALAPDLVVLSVTRGGHEARWVLADLLPLAFTPRFLDHSRH